MSVITHTNLSIISISMAVSPSDWTDLQIDTIPLEFGKIYVLPLAPYTGSQQEQQEQQGFRDSWTFTYQLRTTSQGSPYYTWEKEMWGGDQFFVNEVNRGFGTEYQMTIRTMTTGSTPGIYNVASTLTDYFTPPAFDDFATFETRLTYLYGTWDEGGEPVGEIPALVIDSVSDTSINLSWTGGTAPYYVLRSTNGSVYFTISDARYTQSYSATGLTPETLYYFKVEYSNETGTIESNVASDTTIADPGELVLSQTRIGTTDVDLAWVDTVAGSSGGYLIEVSIDGSSWFEAGTATAGTFATTIDEMTPSTFYYFRVSVSNGSGSIYSNTLTFTTEADLGEVVLTLGAYDSDSIAMTWTSSVVGGTGNYQVDFSLNGSDWSFLADTTELSYEATGLDPSTLYYFRVLTTNGEFVQFDSNTISQTTDSSGGAFDYTSVNPTLLLKPTGVFGSPLVSEWTNEGTVGGFFEQANSSFQPQDGVLIDGVAAINFDGNDNRLIGDMTSGQIIGVASWTMFLIVQPTTVTGTDEDGFSNDHIIGDGGGYWGVTLMSAGGGNFYPQIWQYSNESGLTEVIRATVGSATNVPRLIQVTYDHINLELKIRLDNETVYTKSGAYPVDGNSSVEGIDLGKPSFGTGYYHGALSFILAKDSLLTSGEVGDIRAALQADYPNIAIT